MTAEGWYHDPFGRHDHRWFSDGRPTGLVRDAGVESRDEPPPHDEVVQPIPLDEPTTVDARDLKRADAATAVDQSFSQRDGMRAAIEGSGEFGIGFQ